VLRVTKLLSENNQQFHSVKVSHPLANKTATKVNLLSSNLKAVLIVSIPLMDCYIELQTASFHKFYALVIQNSCGEKPTREPIMDQLSGRKWNWLWHTMRRVMRLCYLKWLNYKFAKPLLYTVYRTTL